MNCCDFNVQIGSVGFDLVVQFLDCEGAKDLSVLAANVYEIRLKNPNGVVLQRPAALLSDGTDGKIHYTTVAGDLDVAGEWKIQGRAHDGPVTQDLWTEIGSFTVKNNLV